MADMKELSDQFKLSVRSVAEVFGVLNNLDTQYGRTRAVQFRGKRLTKEAIVNAAILFLGIQHEETIKAALEQSLARLEHFLSENDDERAEADNRMNASTAGLLNDKLRFSAEDGGGGKATRSAIATLEGETELRPVSTGGSVQHVARRDETEADRKRPQSRKKK